MSVRPLIVGRMYVGLAAALPQVAHPFQQNCPFRSLPTPPHPPPAGLSSQTQSQCINPHYG